MFTDLITTIVITATCQFVDKVFSFQCLRRRENKKRAVVNLLHLLKSFRINNVRHNNTDKFIICHLALLEKYSNYKPHLLRCLKEMANIHTSGIH